MSVFVRILILMLSLLAGVVPGFEPALDAASSMTSQAPPDEAVRVRGVVTFAGPKDFGCFLQEGQSGVRFYVPQEDQTPMVGQWVEVTGTVTANEAILANRIQLLGEAPLPVPRDVQAADMAKARGDYIKIAGQIRASSWNGEHADLWLTTGGARVRVKSQVHQRDLVGAEAAVEGVLILDGQQALVLAQHLEIVRPAPAPVAATAAELSAALVQAARENRRVACAGDIIYQESPVSLYLQDGPSGFHVRLAQPANMPLGTRVMAVGFPEPDGGLADVALSRKPGEASVPAAFEVEASRVGPHLRGLLVSLEGRLVRALPGGGSGALWLESQGLVFGVYSQASVPMLRSGTRVRVTGMCRVHEPGFSVLARTESDVEVLAPPPWWTPGRLAFASAAVALIALALAGGLAARLYRFGRSVSARGARLQEIERLLSSLEQVPQALAVCEEEGSIVWVNQAAEALFQRRGGELRELRLQDLLDPAEAPDFVRWLASTPGVRTWTFRLSTGETARLMVCRAAARDGVMPLVFRTPSAD